MSEKTWVSIEGGVGAGKTTFLERVLPHLAPDLVRIDEPVSRWQASGMLEKSYADPHAYGFAAQVHFFTTRIEEHARALEENPDGRIFLSERSPVTDRLFWNVNLALGRIPADLGPIYLDAWKQWQRCVAPFEQPHWFIYLVTPAARCYDRMRERSRTEEEGVPLDYLQALEEQHDAQFMHADGALMPNGVRVPVVLVDGTRDFRDERVAREIAAEIAAEIKALAP